MTEQALFYKAKTSGNMWDTWLYWRKGTYYLFHLAKGTGNQFHGIAMATSTNGVHWREHGLVLEKAKGVTWLGTGSVWERQTPGPEPEFVLNFSEWRGNGQTIFFAVSRDLLNWKRLGNEYEFRPDGRFYNTGGGNDGRWDCIYTIARPGGGRYGYWTANPLGFTGFGFGESDDGTNWRALPPPRIEWGNTAPMPVIESGAVEKIGGRYYTMLGSYAAYGAYSSGMFSFVADAPAGPFRPLPKNYALLASPSGGRWHTYFTRFFPKDGELLVNHHAIAPDGEVYFAPLKLAEADQAGILRLKWWPGNSAIKQNWTTRPIQGSASTPEIPYDPAAGILIEGSLRTPETANDVPPEMFVACGSDRQGTRFLVRPHGVLEIEDVTPDGNARLLERVDRSLELSGTVSVRLLLMHCFVEIYLGDHLLQAHALPAKPAGKFLVTGVDKDWQSWQPAG